MVTIQQGDTTLELHWEEWEQRVQSGRVHPGTLVRFEPVTGDAFVLASTLDIYTSLTREDERSWADRFRTTVPIVTALLVGVQMRVWWLIFSSRDMSVRDALWMWAPHITEEGQSWRLLSMGILHTDLAHLIGNLVMLAYAGWNIERALGRANVLLIFTASVVGGSVASGYGMPGNPSLGASGGVFGLIGAATVFGIGRSAVRHSGAALATGIEARARRVFGWAVLPYAIVMYGSGFLGDQVDNWAHTGGLITGCLLVLALDPPDLQRRARWNRWVQGGAWLAIATLLAASSVFGARLIATDDVHHAALGQTQEQLARYSSLTYRVPSSWQLKARRCRTWSALSQIGERRAWSVCEFRRKSPTSAHEALALAVAEVESEWGKRAVIEPLSGVVVGGHAGEGARITVQGDPAFVAEIRTATQGIYVLEERWSVDTLYEARLAPLRDSLRASVVWREPEPLAEAREAIEHQPRQREAKVALAEALAAAGHPDEAMSLWTTLRAGAEGDADFWAGYLRTLQWYPAPLIDADGVWVEALSQEPVPKTLAEMARTMASAGDWPGSRALLDLAWERHPGDHHLRAARRDFGMGTALHGVLPVHLAIDPTTGAPPVGQADEPGAAIDLPAVRDRGRRNLTLSTSLLDLAEAQPEQGAGALLVLRRQASPSRLDLTEALVALAADLDAAGEGEPLRWLDPSQAERLHRWVRAHPDLPHRWVAHATEHSHKLGALAASEEALAAGNLARGAALADKRMIDVEALEALGLRAVVQPDTTWHPTALLPTPEVP